MQSKEIMTEFETTFKLALNLLSEISKEQFNLPPEKNKWSAGEIAEHLIKANSDVAGLLTGKTTETERKPDQMVEKIKAVFLNFEQSLQSPDNIVPEKKDYEKDDSLYALKTIKSEIEISAHTDNLTKTCLNFEFPGFGFLTGLEIISFVVYHMQRHIWQLQRLQKSLAAK